MSRKAAIELSVNFLVIIIISLVIFGFGVYFISNLSSKANDLTSMSSNELDKRIGNLLCEGFDRVCIASEKKVIQKKSFDVFGIKVFNVLAKQKFQVTAAVSKRIGFDKVEYAVDSSELTLNPAARPLVEIDQNEERNFALGVQVNPNSKPGIYIIDVQVKREDGTQYGGTVYKLYVEVQ